MAIGRKKEPATFAEIIEPLTGIAKQLETHMANMSDRETGLLEKKTEIEEQISDAIQERESSKVMAERLWDFTCSALQAGKEATSE